MTMVHDGRGRQRRRLHLSGGCSSFGLSFAKAGAQSRGDPPRDGRCQNEAHPNDYRNPEAGVSAQHGQCQHKNKTCTKQNGVYHRIDQYGNSHASYGFPCHRQPFRLHLSAVTHMPTLFLLAPGSDSSDEIPFAQFNTAVPQDVVRRRAVEIKVGQHEEARNPIVALARTDGKARSRAPAYGLSRSAHSASGQGLVPEFGSRGT